VNLWVFDLDGTLITSGIDYARAVFHWELMFIDRMEHRAPHYDKFVPEFLGLLRESEKELFKTMRAHRKRFPTSMVEAYRGLCRNFGMNVDLEIERETWEIGVSALSEETYRNRGMLPGAEAAVGFLQERGDLIYCVTAGDSVVQWMKWRGYNLRRFFPSQREYRVVKWDKLATL
jgi:phosphoserine phosphatase